MKPKKNIAVIGAGPAGCMSVYQILKDKTCAVTLFEAEQPLKTLLYTGGGRCNFSYAEFDNKELVKHYPRGEKFLLSVFSQFNPEDSINFMEEIGIKTYTQEDKRMFPKSNSAKNIREKILNAISECEIKLEKVKTVKKQNNKFLINNKYEFEKVILAIGGHAGYKLAESLGHNIIEPKPALLGLVTKDKFVNLTGVTLNSVKAAIKFKNKIVKVSNIDLCADFIFTHKGISGPLAYIVSSICARLDYSAKNPIFLTLNFLDKDIDFQQILNDNPKKYIKNIISAFVPKSMAEYILNQCEIDEETLCHEINRIQKQAILKQLTSFEIIITGNVKEGEVVTSGGVVLDEINSKTMESKITEGLYFCGEIIDVDGFCGGFNLQNCWSTGYIAGKAASGS